MRIYSIYKIVLFSFVTSFALSSQAYSADPVGNACPPEGCLIEITKVEKSGTELLISWSANFLPDVSRNHIHVYWDNFKAEEVSSDAEANGFEQGDWVPTSAYPDFTTEGAMALVNRGESTKICVTTGNRDHVVIDAKAVHCMDISGAL